MSKKLIQENKTTLFNPETGEFRQYSQEKTISKVDSEPDYVKIYYGTQLSLNNLNPSLAPVIIAFSQHISWADNRQIVHTDEFCRESVAKQLNVSIKRVDQYIAELVNSGLFIPVYKSVEVNGVVTNRKKRGIYFVNPFIIAKGAWKDIKTLRQTISFDQGKTSYYIDKGDGVTEINCKLPDCFMQDNDGQLQLNFNENGNKK